MVVGDSDNICNDTSVLNDGDVPVLSGVSNDSRTSWAARLFTMRRVGAMGRIIVSFELNNTNHNRVELAVFNCPEIMGINTPSVNIYFGDVFRPESVNNSVGELNTYRVMPKTSCDGLLTFCVEYEGSRSSRYINIEFPFEENVISLYVFLGEVTFLSGNCTGKYSVIKSITVSGYTSFPAHVQKRGLCV